MLVGKLKPLLEPQNDDLNKDDGMVLLIFVFIVAEKEGKGNFI